MMNASMKMLCELSDLHGCPSGEKSIREYLKQKYEKLADEVIYDNLGGVFGVKHSKDSNAPRLLAAGHMDEVGFMAVRIRPNGMLEVKKLGNAWDGALISQRVYVHTKNKKIIGMISPLDSEPRTDAIWTIDDCVVDIGASSEEEVMEWGIYPGQLITFATEAVVMNNGRMIMGKAWDDRAGCAMGVDIMKAVADAELNCNFYAGGTVQEEGGRRGAIAASNLIKPDVFFALEGPQANDISGKADAFGKLGQGVLIRILDRELKLSQEFRDYLLDTVHTHNIPYQFYVSKGGTDAGLIQTSGKGVQSAVIAVPVRCRHSAQSIMHMDDYDAAVELMKQIVLTFDRSVYETLLNR